MEFLKKHWFPVMIVAIIITIAVIVMRQRNTTNNQSSDYNFFGSGGSGSGGGLDENKLLSQGATGPEVKELQTLINQGYEIGGIDKSLTADGVFGPLTSQALMELTGTASITLADARFFIGQYS